MSPNRFCTVPTKIKGGERTSKSCSNHYHRLQSSPYSYRIYFRIRSITYIVLTNNKTKASMASNGLSAGAASFKPMGAPAADIETSVVKDKDDSSSFEQHQEVSGGNETVEAVKNTGTNAGTALPSHLAAHAAEFWFPECRDCSCCNGFKHGCTCAPSNYGICSVCSGVQTSDPNPPVKAASTGSKSQCRFFSSPRGCKFGDSCRFSHS
jgi:hypothetical protein